MSAAYPKVEITGEVKSALDNFERELARFERARAALYDEETGAKIYSDPVHEKKFEELHKPVREAAERASALAHKLSQEADDLETEEEAGDPFDYLDDATMARANARRDFVIEEVQSLLPPFLLRRLQEIKRRGDKAELFLYSRYAAERIGELHGPEQERARELIEGMQDKLRPASDPRKQAERKRLQAHELSKVGKRLWDIDGSLEREKERLLATGRYSYL